MIWVVLSRNMIQYDTGNPWLWWEKPLVLVSIHRIQMSNRRSHKMIWFNWANSGSHIARNPSVPVSLISKQKLRFRRSTTFFRSKSYSGNWTNGYLNDLKWIHKCIQVAYYLVRWFTELHRDNGHTWSTSCGTRPTMFRRARSPSFVVSRPGRVRHAVGVTMG